MSTPRLDIERLLGSVRSDGGFATHFTLPSDDLRLDIEGLGSLPLPIDGLVARELCNAAQLARHGYKTQTRLDTRVRHTWEIPASRVRVDEARWQRTLEPALQRIRKELGLPEGRRLRAELHNLLVYEAGQFFAPHQDSEKADGMLGTLVVGLPSRYTGGRFVIEHQGKRLRIGGSAKQLGFTAFYADCHHETQAVKSGFRIVLTYNLIAEPEATVAAPSPVLVSEPLHKAVQRFFSTSAPPRWAGEGRLPPPDRLVYLLDYQYSRRGLAWNMLKGADALRAAALREVAQRLDCEIILALADVHETWSCEDLDAGRGYRSWYEDENEDEDDDDLEPEGRYRLTELIDDDVELRHGVAPDGSAADVMGAYVKRGELCLTRASKDCDPFQSEYEGYMGNYGNTLDRWYHRAAVVLWPRARAFAIRAKASPRWALQQIKASMRLGEPARVQSQIEVVLSFWGRNLPEQDGALAKLALQVAVGLSDAKASAALLDPLCLTSIPSSAGTQLTQLLARHGRSWCEQRLRHWLPEASARQAQPDTATQLQWTASALVPLCRALCRFDANDGRTLARSLLVERWTWLQGNTRERIHAARARDLPDILQESVLPLLAIIEASRITEHAETHRHVLRQLIGTSGAFPLTLAIGILRAAHDSARPGSLGLATLHDHALGEVQRLLGLPVRADEDWSISAALRCGCELCTTLAAFLQSPTETSKQWPLAKERRAHIHQAIDAADLPVTHTTHRTGRPYTLVLQKSQALFQRAALERQRMSEDLAWLRGTAGTF